MHAVLFAGGFTGSSGTWCMACWGLQGSDDCACIAQGHSKQTASPSAATTACIASSPIPLPDTECSTASYTAASFLCYCFAPFSSLLTPPVTLEITLQARETSTASTARVWMKSAIVEREAGDAAAERALLAEGLRRFPGFWKLHLMAGQLEAREGKVEATRAAYAAGGAWPGLCWDLLKAETPLRSRAR